MWYFPKKQAYMNTDTGKNIIALLPLTVGNKQTRCHPELCFTAFLCCVSTATEVNGAVNDSLKPRPADKETSSLKVHRKIVKWVLLFHQNTCTTPIPHTHTRQNTPLSYSNSSTAFIWCQIRFGVMEASRWTRGTGTESSLVTEQQPWHDLHSAIWMSSGCVAGFLRHVSPLCWQKQTARLN